MARHSALVRLVRSPPALLAQMARAPQVLLP
jgi:hypothetical protein